MRQTVQTCPDQTRPDQIRPELCDRAVSAPFAVPVSVPFAGGVTVVPGEAEMRLVDAVRLAAARARSKPHVDAFRACAMLSMDRNRSGEAMADGLARILGQALGLRPRFHRVGSCELSFDERWLLRLAERLRADDLASAEFLLRSRVGQPHRRGIAFLLQGVAAKLAG